MKDYHQITFGLVVNVLLGMLGIECIVEIVKLNIKKMVIINKLTGRNVSAEYLGLMEGIMTNEEFEEVACISITEGIVNVVNNEE